MGCSFIGNNSITQSALKSCFISRMLETALCTSHPMVQPVCFVDLILSGAVLRLLIHLLLAWNPKITQPCA